MPRINYIIAWTNLKDILAVAQRAGVDVMATGAIYGLMLNLEHPGLDWNKLDEILQHLKSPPGH